MWKVINSEICDKAFMKQVQLGNRNQLNDKFKSRDIGMYVKQMTSNPRMKITIMSGALKLNFQLDTQGEKNPKRMNQQ